MEPRPPDFSLRYEWNEGSLPPPDYYEYCIRIGPGTACEIVFRPDYPQHDPPTWRVPFATDEKALDQLYEAAAEAGVFKRVWERRSNPPVGGSLEWIELTAGGNTVRVPSMARGAGRLKPLYRMIHALVPHAIWEDLRGRREQFLRAYPQTD